MKNHNILFHQIQIDSAGKRIVEISPDYFGLETKHLSIDVEGSLHWDTPNPLDLKGRLRNTNLYFKDSNIGVGRSPNFNAKFDLEANVDQLETIIHIGDGSYGFSMGNGTSKGFIPEIIGMGADENDAGLYFMGKTKSDVSSNIPLVIVGGLSPKGNRPILGITSSKYDEYEFLVDQQGMVHVNDIKINGSITFKETLQIIQDQQQTINELVDRVNEISKNIS